MEHKLKTFSLKYGIPILAVVVVMIQLYFVHSKRLNKWKGGGYGMYTGIHYYYDQVYSPNLSVDSLIKDNKEMTYTLGFLRLMPNDENLKKAAEFVLKATKRDSIHLQIWRPTVNSKNGVYSRVLINEIHLNNIEL